VPSTKPRRRPVSAWHGRPGPGRPRVAEPGLPSPGPSGPPQAIEGAFKTGGFGSARQGQLHGPRRAPARAQQGWSARGPNAARGPARARSRAVPRAGGGQRHASAPGPGGETAHGSRPTECGPLPPAAALPGDLEGEANPLVLRPGRLRGRVGAPAEGRCVISHTAPPSPYARGRYGSCWSRRGPRAARRGGGGSLTPPVRLNRMPPRRPRAFDPTPKSPPVGAGTARSSPAAAPRARGGGSALRAASPAPRRGSLHLRAARLPPP
jgi:hypothetical protein